MKTFNETQNVTTVIITGDIMQHQKQLNYEADNDYIGVFDDVKPFLKGDIVIGNLETTFAGDSKIKPNSGSPLFSAHDSLAKAIKGAGFTHIAISNNHTYDRGLKGLKRTVDVLENVGLVVLGQKTKITHNNTFFNVINFTTHLNGKSDSKILIDNVNDLPKVEVADWNIALPHWGGQYNPQENAEQVLFTEKLFEMGYDIIAGSGPHVPHRIEIKDDNKLVAYSLGDFLSDHQKSAAKDSGLILKLTLQNNKLEATTIQTNTLTDNGQSRIVYKNIQYYSN